MAEHRIDTAVGGGLGTEKADIMSLQWAPSPTHPGLP